MLLSYQNTCRIVGDPTAYAGVQGINVREGATMKLNIPQSIAMIIVLVFEVLYMLIMTPIMFIVGGIRGVIEVWR